jgi:hypothetical protein
MKKLFLLLTVICLFSCSKENIPSISGIWTIVETNAEIGGGVQVQTYPPSSEVTMEFGANGQLILTGTNPGRAMSPLWDYDRYEVLPDQVIRFYKSFNGEEMKAFFTVEGDLFLNYLTVRCGYEEKFLRLK